MATARKLLKPDGSVPTKFHKITWNLYVNDYKYGINGFFFFNVLLFLVILFSWNRMQTIEPIQCMVSYNKNLIESTKSKNNY